MPPRPGHQRASPVCSSFVTHPYMRAFLSAVPVPDPTVRRERLRLSGEVPSPIDIPAGCRLRGRCPLAQAVGAEPVTLREVAPRHRVACHLA